MVRCQSKARDKSSLCTLGHDSSTKTRALARRRQDENGGRVTDLPIGSSRDQHDTRQKRLIEARERGAMALL
jgi:hypothetical protein